MSALLLYLLHFAKEKKGGEEAPANRSKVLSSSLRFERKEEE